MHCVEMSSEKRKYVEISLAATSRRIKRSGKVRLCESGNRSRAQPAEGRIRMQHSQRSAVGAESSSDFLHPSSDENNGKSKRNEKQKH